MYSILRRVRPKVRYNPTRLVRSRTPLNTQRLLRPSPLWRAPALPSRLIHIPRTHVLFNSFQRCRYSTHKLVPFSPLQVEEYNQMTHVTKRHLENEDFTAAVTTLESLLPVIDSTRTGTDKRPNPQVVLQFAEGMSSLATLYNLEGEFDKAASVLEDLLYSLLEFEKVKTEHVERAKRENNPVLIEKHESELIRAKIAICGVSTDLGRAYENSGDYEQAQKAYKTALQRAEAQEDVYAAGNISTHLGILYDRVGNFAESEKYYIKALKTMGHIERLENPLFASSLHPMQVVSVRWAQLVEPETVEMFEKQLNAIDIGNGNNATLALPDSTSAFAELKQKETNKELAKMQKMLSHARAQIEEVKRIANKLTMSARDVRNSYEEQLNYCLQTIERLENKHGSHHMSLLTPLYQAFGVYRGLYMTTEAFDTLNRIEEIYRKHMTPGGENADTGSHPYVVRSDAVLHYHLANVDIQRAFLCLTLQQWSEAESYLKNAFAVKCTLLGDKSLQTMLLKADLHTIFVHDLKFKDATLVMDEAKQGITKLMGAEHFYSKVLEALDSRLWTLWALDEARRSIEKTPGGKHVDWEPGQPPSLDS